MLNSKVKYSVNTMCFLKNSFSLHSSYALANRIGSSWTRLALGGQTNSPVSLQGHGSHKKSYFKAGYPLFHWLIIGWWTSLNLRWLGLGDQTVKKLLWLACKFDLNQSESKSLQVNTSARIRPGQMESQIDPSFNLQLPGLYKYKFRFSLFPGIKIYSNNNWTVYSMFQLTWRNVGVQVKSVSLACRQFGCAPGH